MIVGLGLILAGANFLTDGSAALAQRFRVPEYEMTPEGIRITAPPLEQSRAVTVKSLLPPDLRALFGEDSLEI